MSLFCRYYICSANRCCLFALALIWPLLTLTQLQRELARGNPVLSIRPGLALVLSFELSAPIAFALASAGGTTLFAHVLGSTGEDQILATSGIRRRRILLWGMTPALLLATASLGFLVESHPKTARVVRDLDFIRDRKLARAVEVLGRTRKNKRFIVSGKSLDGRTLGDFRFLHDWTKGQESTPSVVAFGADRARLHRENGNSLIVDLESGFLIQCGESGLPDLRFRQARIQLNLAEIAGRKIRHPWWKPDSRSLFSLHADQKMAAESSRGQGNAARYCFEFPFRLVLGLLPAWVAWPLLLVLRFGSKAKSVVAFIIMGPGTLLLLAMSHSLAESHLVLAFSVIAAALLLPVAGLLVGMRLLRRGCPG